MKTKTTIKPVLRRLLKGCSTAFHSLLNTRSKKEFKRLKDFINS
jgi:hypothetical protein